MTLKARLADIRMCTILGRNGSMTTAGAFKARSGSPIIAASVAGVVALVAYLAWPFLSMFSERTWSRSSGGGGACPPVASIVMLVGVLLLGVVLYLLATVTPVQQPAVGL
jgi:hypothetical protein